jgi:hypothetical protein
MKKAYNKFPTNINTIKRGNKWCAPFVKLNLFKCIWGLFHTKYYQTEESVMEDPSFTIKLVHQIPPHTPNVNCLNKVLELFK